MVEYEDLVMGNEANKGTQDGGKLGETDSDKWEMDVDTTLDRLYHGWLGEKLKGGVWTLDKRLKRVMNEKCASYLIQVLHSHFNVNMQFSVLEQEEIDEILTSVWSVVNKVLTENYEEYEVEVNMIDSITYSVRNALWMWLNIPKMGGMRIYKGEKTKTIISKREQSSDQSY